MAQPQTTTIPRYTTLLISAAAGESDLTAATGYNVGVPAPGGDLDPVNLIHLAPPITGGRETEANAPILTCYATASDNDSVDIALYGIVAGGAPERIANLLWTFGAAIRSTNIRWADTCVATVTSSNSNRITVEDSGNDRIASVSFDGKGIEYLYAIAYNRTTGTATNITVELRYF